MATKKEHTKKTMVAKIWMLRWMCGKNRKDRICDEQKHEMVKVFYCRVNEFESEIRLHIMYYS